MIEILLILTMNGKYYGSSIQTIKTSSIQECKYIGEQWKSQKMDKRSNFNLSYICVKKKGE